MSTTISLSFVKIGRKKKDDFSDVQINLNIAKVNFFVLHPILMKLSEIVVLMSQKCEAPQQIFIFWHTCPAKLKTTRFC